MSEQRHMIQRQVIELSVRDAAQADRLHAEVSRIYRQRLVPLIEQCCTELSAPDQLDRVERLELDLGAIDEQQLETELVAGVQAMLRPALAAQIAAAAAAGRSSRATAWLELLALFARTGTLPWWADTATPRLLENGLRYLQANAAEPLCRLLGELSGEPGSLQRLVDHLPDDVLALLATTLAPAIPPSLLARVSALLGDPRATAGLGLTRQRRSIWGAILRVAAVDRWPPAAAASFYGAILQQVAGERGVGDATLLTDLRAALEHARPLPPEVAVAADDAHTRGGGDVDTLYVGNAGLVILWPFLPEFFASLGLVAGERFTSPAAQQRAAALLQHLASGEVAFAEYLLPLNKLLCGLPLDSVFDGGDPLEAAEVTACAEFLSAVIARAPILRAMSLPGFRGTFLLRPAALSTRDGAWLLRVERQTYDIVLERFPWGWEWLRLPWMETPLRVEW